MKLSPEIIAKFVAGLMPLLVGLGLFTIDDTEVLTNAVNTAVQGIFILVGALGIFRTFFKAKRHKEQEDTRAGDV